MLDSFRSPVLLPRNPNVFQVVLAIARFGLIAVSPFAMIPAYGCCSSRIIAWRPGGVLAAGCIPGFAVIGLDWAERGRLSAATRLDLAGRRVQDPNYAGWIGRMELVTPDKTISGGCFGVVGGCSISQTTPVVAGEDLSAGAELRPRLLQAPPEPMQEVAVALRLLMSCRLTWALQNDGVPSGPGGLTAPRSLRACDA